MADWRPYFPFPEARDAQEKLLDFAVKNIKNCRFLVAQMPTGTGKSGIAIALSKWIQNNFDSFGCKKGSYIVTTQKILQQQYIDTFSDITNIWSKSNYRCTHRKSISCEEGKLISKLFPDTKESIQCTHSCVYTMARNAFFSSPVGVTNIAYMLNQVGYRMPDQEPRQRQLLVIDECHNLEQSIVDFVSCGITKRHCEDDLKIKPRQRKPAISYPDEFSNIWKTRDWVEDIYMPAITAKLKVVEAEMAKANPKSSESRQLTKQYASLDKQMCKNKRFIDRFDPDGWVVTYTPEFFEIKPIHASRFAEDAIFQLGKKVLLMSGTILDKETFCRNNGIPKEETAFISLESPFPVKNRQVCIVPVVSMSFKNINQSLPKMSNAVQSLLKQHKGEKGIIHTHTYRIAKYIKEHDKSGRMLLHNPSNRIDILEDHLNSREDSVLVSPSFTEGIDLIHNTSRFQIVCKIPFPFLQDNYIKTKMKKCKNWYEWQTAKTIIQCLGRSIRSIEDYAISYVLDADWEYFYYNNKFLFPKWFREALIIV